MDDSDMGADTTTAPQIPDQRHFDPPSHFDTPSWLGPDRTHRQAPVIPEQPEPLHDRHPAAPAPFERDTKVIAAGHWVESAPPRKLAGTILVLAVLGLLGTLVAAVIVQTPLMIGAAVACAVVVVTLRVAMISSGVTTTELKNGHLTVLRDGVKDEFNLTDPVHLVELVGRPGDSTWRLRLETVDGRIVELGPNHVDAAELHPAVAHYRLVAEAERLDRERRFRR